MLKHAIVVWIVLAAAIAVTAALVPSVEVDGGVFTLLGIALLFGIVNAFIGPLLRLVSLPLTVATFGLFALVINGALLTLTAGISNDLEVGGFLAAVGAALLISIVAAVLEYGASKLLPG